MPVSPADSSNAQPPPHWIARLHAAQLTTLDAEMGQHLLQDFHALLQQRAAESLQTLGAQGIRVQQCLGEGEPVLNSAGEILVQEARTLDTIAEGLTRSYDVMLTEMATQGRQAVKNSLHYSGREQVEELRDGVRLLRGVVEHPIGSRNYVAWFEIGWALWMLGEPLATAEDAFYQAARLSGTTRDIYHYLAIRHNCYLQALQDKSVEAWLTAQRLLNGAIEQPEIWVELARYAALAGKDDEALSLIEKALDHEPNLALTVFADPDLVRLHPACATLIERFTQVAREAAAKDIARLMGTYTLEERLKDEFGIDVNLPPQSLPGSAAECSLFDARHLARSASEEANALIDLAIQTTEKVRKEAIETSRRFKLQIDQALSEKTYWEDSIKHVEEEARLAGFSLHPYTFSNPFLRRKNQRAEQARILYESCKQNMDRVEDFIKNHLPAMQAAAEKHERRRLAIDDALAWLKSQLR